LSRQLRANEESVWAVADPRDPNRRMYFIYRRHLVFL
jgi:hypothetical protein